MSATTTRGVYCGNCHNYHPSAAAVRYCYTGEGESVMQEDPQPQWTGSNTKDSPLQYGAPAASTLAQHRFIQRLRTEKGEPQCGDAFLHALTKRQASDEINRLKAMPSVFKESNHPAKVKHGEYVGNTGLQRGGVHVVDGRYYRVHQSQNSGNLYACLWNGEGFDYAAGAIKLLNPGNKATAEQAAAFGAMTERCCFCAKAIDTPESVAVGYGPICAAKFGLPWGDTTTGPVAV